MYVYISSQNCNIFCFLIQDHDRELAEAVLKSVYRHMWYMSEELVVLALADKGCDVDIKSRMAARLQVTPRPAAFAPGKPAMKVDLLENAPTDAPQLYHFIGEHSWLFFHLFHLQTEWLGLPVDQWDTQRSYQEFCLITSNINVVNDAAERAVKDVTDFANYSQDADRRDDVVKVVNSHRELIDFRHLTKDEIANI